MPLSCPVLSCPEYPGDTARGAQTETPLKQACDAITEAYGMFPTLKQRKSLELLVDNYPDGFLNRIAYGVKLASDQGKTSPNYAIACAESASSQELDKFKPKVSTCLTCNGTGTKDDAECDVCLGTGRQLSDSEFKEVIRARSQA